MKQVKQQPTKKKQINTFINQTLPLRFQIKHSYVQKYKAKKGIENSRA